MQKPRFLTRRPLRVGFLMAAIVGMLALCIFIVIVWWTMFSGRSKGELRQTPATPEQKPNEASEHAPINALSEAAPTASSSPNAKPDDTRR
jgi:cytoskeletal protein RodZ